MDSLWFSNRIYSRLLSSWTYICPRERDFIQNLSCSFISPFLQQETYNYMTANDCAICLCRLGETVPDFVAPECKHTFHKSCIDAYLQLGKSTCPLCRTAWSRPSADTRSPFSDDDPVDATALSAQGLLANSVLNVQIQFPAKPILGTLAQTITALVTVNTAPIPSSLEATHSVGPGDNERQGDEGQYSPKRSRLCSGHRDATKTVHAADAV